MTVGQAGHRGYGPPLVHMSGDQLGWFDQLEMAGMAQLGPHVWSLGLLCMASTRPEMSTVVALLTCQAPELGCLGQWVAQALLCLSLWASSEHGSLRKYSSTAYMVPASPERTFCQELLFLKAGPGTDRASLLSDAIGQSCH